MMISSVWIVSAFFVGMIVGEWRVRRAVHRALDSKGVPR